MNSTLLQNKLAQYEALVLIMLADLLRNIDVNNSYLTTYAEKYDIKGTLIDSNPGKRGRRISGAIFRLVMNGLVQQHRGKLYLTSTGFDNAIKIMAESKNPDFTMAFY